MRSHLFLALALLLAGCVNTDAPAADIETAAVGADGLALEPVVQELTGRAAASPAAVLAHQDAQTEKAVMPVHREGFILDVIAVPTMLQIEIEWSGTVAGEMVPMVNVPTGANGEVIDYFGEWSGSGLACMRLPVDELQPDRISLMAHSRNAANVDYVIRVTTIGGETKLLDAPHMEVERSDPTEGKPLPCDAADA